MTFEKLQEINNTLQPIREAATELKSARAARDATQESMARIEAELGELERALDAAEVAAAMEPTASTKKALETVRGKIAACEEQANSMRARIRGLSRGMADLEAQIAASAGAVKQARHRLIEDAQRTFEPIYHEALQQFLAVLALGRRMAETAGAESLRIRLNSVRLPDLATGNTITWGEIESRIQPEALSGIEHLAQVVDGLNAVADAVQRAEASQKQIQMAQPDLGPDGPRVVQTFDREAAERMRREREERERAEAQERMAETLRRRGRVAIRHAI